MQKVIILFIKRCFKVIFPTFFRWIFVSMKTGITPSICNEFLYFLFQMITTTYLHVLISVPSTKNMHCHPRTPLYPHTPGLSIAMSSKLILNKKAPVFLHINRLPHQSFSLYFSLTFSFLWEHQNTSCMEESQIMWL